MAQASFQANSWWGALEVGFTLLTAPVSRRWFGRWGATEAETRRALPGDEIVGDVRIAYTRAVTINAPRAQVWPWIVQWGQGRGGLYSYDGLENLVGCDIHSVDRILPEYQNLKVGDLIALGPVEKQFPAFIVRAIDPERALVLSSADNKTHEAINMSTTVFYLEDAGPGRTRLIVRGRLTYPAGWANSVMWHIVEPLNFVMERRTMLGIKARAEAM